MKKLFFFAALAVFALASSFAQEDGSSSSTDVSFGIKAGVNLSSITGDDVDELDGRTSFHVGGVVNIGISELFAVQPEVVYSTQGATFDMGGIDGTFRLDYINIPVLADITVAEGFSLQGGPQIGFNITSEVEVDGETADVDEVETVDIAAAIGAQYRLPMGLFFQARYVIGISNINSDTDDIKNQNAVFSISTGWFFN